MVVRNGPFFVTASKNINRSKRGQNLLEYNYFAFCTKVQFKFLKHSVETKLRLFALKVF